jgi:hypothetical protein
MRFLCAVGTVIVSGAAALLLAGCGSSRTSSPTAGRAIPINGTQSQEVGDLAQIGQAYHSYWGSNNGTGPAKLEDLYPYVNGAGSPPSQGLASGKYVVYLNVSREFALKTGGGHTVLGYYERVPAAGGPVLMTYSGVENMTADEFKNAHKAGQ